MIDMYESSHHWQRAVPILRHVHTNAEAEAAELL